jgi:hypothetical protein
MSASSFARINYRRSKNRKVPDGLSQIRNKRS